MGRDDMIQKAVASYASYIAKETLSDSLLFADNSGRDIKVDEKVITLSIEKANA